MTTVTFKVDETRLEKYRRRAKAANISLSELIRRRMDGEGSEIPPKRKQEYAHCEFTGARIFKGYPDDLSSCRIFPAWCKGAKHTTDSNLLALADKHGLKLATLDGGIPGAFVIPI